MGTMRSTACSLALSLLLPLVSLADWRGDYDADCAQFLTPPTVDLSALRQGLIFYAGFNNTTAEQFGHTVGGSTCGFTNDAVAGGFSAYFNASDKKYIYYTSPANYIFATNFSFSVWLKDLSTGTSDQYPFGTTRTTVPYGQWNLYYVGGSTQFMASSFLASSGGQDFSRGPTGMTKRVWHHIVCTYRRDAVNWQKSEIYIDGSLAGTNATWTGSAANTSMNLNFGARGVDWAAPFNGLIDEAAIWSNRILNASDVSDLWNNGSGLALY
jgi:hypothetical protein